MNDLVFQISRFKRKNISAFSLLEVMIALVIFAVGLLGLAGMQVIALENSFESSSRNQAIILAYSMSDRMLANRKGQDQYILSVNDKRLTNQSCVTNTCNFSQVVSYDQSQWQQNLKDLLFSGSGAITGQYPGYTITVRWDENRNGATGTNCPVIDENDLRCFQLQVQL